MADFDKKGSIFTQLEIEAFKKGITPKTKESIEWFRKRVRELYRGRHDVAQKKVMVDPMVKLKSKPTTKAYANLCLFFYDAKTKDQLKYWDAAPLVFPIASFTGKGGAKGFTGLNMHYLPPIHRAKVLDAFLNGGSIPKRYMEPMIHNYLFSHIRSRVAHIETPEWEIAAFLPLAAWNKDTAKNVYADSRRKMKR